MLTSKILIKEFFATNKWSQVYFPSFISQCLRFFIYILKHNSLYIHYSHQQRMKLHTELKIPFLRLPFFALTTYFLHLRIYFCCHISFFFRNIEKVELKLFILKFFSLCSSRKSNVQLQTRIM